MRSELIVMSVLSVSVLGLAAGSATAESVPGEVIVRFDVQPDTAVLQQIEKAVGISMSWTAPKHAPHAKNGAGVPHPLSFYRVAHVGDEVNTDGVIELISAMPGITLATPNNIPEPAGFPNDPLYNQQWSHTKMNTEDAWAVSTGDTGIIVGVIDTGSVVDHEDLANTWVNDDPVNGIDDDNNGFIDDTFGWDFSNNNNNVDDVFGHGTQVTGIIGGEINNGIGIAGIANVTVMQSKWWHFSGSDMSVAESVFYAVDNGAHIVNLSLSCGCLLPMSEVAVNYAYDNNVLVVSASGNAGGSAPHYPASYANSMSVSAIDINDNRPGFSNFGPLLDLGAPSPDIYSTGPNGPTDYDVDFRGTSAAAPHVAGAAALVLSVDPSLTPDEVRVLLNDTAFDLGSPGFDDQFGHGRLDIGAAIAAIAVDCDGDVDGNGEVDVTDLLMLLASWGACGGCPADLDGNGEVDTVDLLMLLAGWGPC